jgi:hypothetical protein
MDRSGARIAPAFSADLIHWQRLGPVKWLFGTFRGKRMFFCLALGHQKMLDSGDPRTIVYRSTMSILVPGVDNSAQASGRISSTAMAMT